jgi:glycosyltransferase involved in cell wall biosynthesis/predicted negative regulator of RcsB-dependent stress response
MIVRNEAKDLADCLHSAKGCVDEVIVVDTGSTDGTAEIARNSGARVVAIPWRDHFAAARNAALEAATREWILVLDADERIAEGDGYKVKAAAARAAASSYRVEIQSDVGGAQLQSSILVRMFRNDPSIRYVRRIHESVNEALVAWNARTGQRTLDLDVRIRHFGYVPDRFQQLKKRERNLRLHRLTVDDDPRDPYSWYRYGDELRAVDPKAAVEPLHKAWKLLEQMPESARRAHVYAPEVAVVLAWLEVQGGDARTALEILQKGERQLGVTPNGLYVRALAQLQLKHSAEALSDFEALRKLDGKRFEAPVQPGITGITACLGAADACLQSGDTAAAERWLREALSLQPDHSRATMQLARIYHSTGRKAQARQALDQYIQKRPHDGAAWALSGEFAFDAGAFDAACKRLSIAAGAPDAPEWVAAKLAQARKLAATS